MPQTPRVTGRLPLQIGWELSYLRRNGLLSHLYWQARYTPINFLGKITDPSYKVVVYSTVTLGGKRLWKVHYVGLQSKENSLHGTKNRRKRRSTEDSVDLRSDSCVPNLFFLSLRPTVLSLTLKCGLFLFFDSLEVFPRFSFFSPSPMHIQFYGAKGQDH